MNKIGTIVSQSRSDVSSSLTFTVAVETDDNDIYSDVLLTYPTTQHHFVPKVGTRVIVSTLDNGKPFISGYINTIQPDSNTTPFQDTYQSIVTDNLTLQEDSSTTLSLYKDTSVASNSQLRLSFPTLYSQLTKLSSNIDTLQLKLNQSTLKLEHLIRTVTTQQDTIELLHQSITTKSEEIDTLLQKISSLKSQIEEVEISTNNISLEAKKSFVLSSKDISLSSDSPSDAPVLYNKLNSILTELIQNIQLLTVTCAAPGSPSTPPVNAPAFASISTKLSTLKSNYIKID